MSFDPREPLDAMVLSDGDASPRRTGSRLLVITCVVVGLLFFGLMSGALAWLSGGHLGAEGVLPWQTAEQRRERLVAAFDGCRTDIHDPDLPEIMQLLDAIASTSRRDDFDGFRRLRDLDGFLQRIVAYPGQKHINLVDRAVLRFYIQRNEDNVGDIERFEVVRVDRPAADQAIVYAWAFNDFVRGDPFRFLLRRTRGGWKVQDWEEVEEGWSQAEHFARALIVGDERALNRYDQVWEQLEQVNTWIEAEETDRARMQLRSIAQTRLPALLAPMTDWRIALLYSYLDDWDECLEICDRVIQSECMPAIYMLQATALNALGRHEEALSALERYEHAAGFRADVIELKAEVLTALGRQDEALACHRRLAQFLPDDLMAVSDFYDALPPQRRSEAVELLALARDPVAAAVEWSGWWFYRDDHALLAMLEDFVRGRAPDSLQAVVLKGRVSAYQGRFDLAADCYRSAAQRETNVESRLEYWDEFLDAMAKEGRGIEAYQAMLDGQRAFEVLARGERVGNGLPPDDLRELMDAHRQRFPDDPRLHYYAGVLAAQRGDLAAAEREFALAVELGDAPLASEAAAAHRDALVRQGNLLDAYHAYADQPEVFAELAARCSDDRDADGLSQLLDQRPELPPTDPSLTYYRTVLKRLQGNHAAAREALQEIEVDAESQPFWNRRVRELRARLHIELGSWREAYAASSQPTETFQDLAFALSQHRDWSALQELCKRHHAAVPDDPDWLSWAIDSASERRDFSEIVQGLTPWPENRNDPPFRTAIFRTQLITSLLRLGRVDEAFARAQHFADMDGDPWSCLIVLDHQRRWTEFADLLEEPDLAERFMNSLRWSESHHFRNVRWDSEAADLRRRFPLPPPSRESGGLVVLLIAEAPLIDREGLQPLAGDDGRWVIRDLPAAPEGALAQFQILAPAGRIIVTAGSGTYASDASIQRLSPRLDDLASLLRSHDGWIAVEGVELDEALDRVRLESVVRRLAADLIDDGLRAVYLEDARTWTTRLAVARADLESHLRAAQSPANPWTDGAVVHLEPRELANQLATHHTDARSQRKLRMIAHSLDGQQPSDMLIRVPQRLGHASENLTLRVVAVQHLGYGEYRWIGELATDSRLWPGLKAGEVLRIDSDQIGSWSLDSGPLRSPDADANGANES